MEERRKRTKTVRGRESEVNEKEQAKEEVGKRRFPDASCRKGNDFKVSLN